MYPACLSANHPHRGCSDGIRELTDETCYVIPAPEWPGRSACTAWQPTAPPPCAGLPKALLDHVLESRNGSVGAIMGPAREIPQEYTHRARSGGRISTESIVVVQGTRRGARPHADRLCTNMAGIKPTTRFSGGGRKAEGRVDGLRPGGWSGCDPELNSYLLHISITA